MSYWWRASTGEQDRAPFATEANQGEIHSRRRSVPGDEEGERMSVPVIENSGKVKRSSLTPISRVGAEANESAGK